MVVRHLHFSTHRSSPRPDLRPRPSMELLTDCATRPRAMLPTHLPIGPPYVLHQAPQPCFLQQQLRHQALDVVLCVGTVCGSPVPLCVLRSSPPSLCCAMSTHVAFTTCSSTSTIGLPIVRYSSSNRSLPPTQPHRPASHPCAQVVFALVIDETPGFYSRLMSID